MRFQYDAVDVTGRRLRGTEAAATSSAAQGALEARGLLVLRVAPDEQPDKRLGSMLGGGRDLVDVTRALGSLLTAGLPLAKALASVAPLVSGPVAEALDQVRARVDRGEPVASAMGAYPAIFPSLYRGLVRAGERSGDLAGAFQRLAVQLEREQVLRSRLLSAAIYPCVLLVAGAAALVILLAFVVPRFAQLLTDTGLALPASTRMLVDVSDLFARGWPILVVILAAAGALVVFGRERPEVRRGLAGLALRLPLLGDLRRSAVSGRVARILEVLLHGGATLLTAVVEAAESVGDPIAAAEVRRLAERLREGASLHRAIRESSYFPPVLVQLVAVGEESGRLPEFLAKAADLLEERTARAAERLVTLLEPAMIVVFGGMVGFVALGLLQAVYGMNAGALR